MTCENKVEFWIPAGYDYMKTSAKCGWTDPLGNRTICRDCASDRAEMECIERHEENVKADNDWLRSAGWGEM